MIAADVQKAKTALDAALIGLPPNNAILFGIDLFDEFRQRGWFTLENFGILGTQFLAQELPAYDKTHFVCSTWSIPVDEFRVK
jgi:hypothetical protein